MKHTIKIVIRVERGDDKFVDKRGRRKRWDIVVQVGVNMLAVSTRLFTDARALIPPFKCQCSGRWSSLPRYSAADPLGTAANLNPPTCLANQADSPDAIISRIQLPPNQTSLAPEREVRPVRRPGILPTDINMKD